MYTVILLLNLSHFGMVGTRRLIAIGTLGLIEFHSLGDWTAQSNSCRGKKIIPHVFLLHFFSGLIFFFFFSFYGLGLLGAEGWERCQWWETNPGMVVSYEIGSQGRGFGFIPKGTGKRHIYKSAGVSFTSLPSTRFGFISLNTGNERVARMAFWFWYGCRIFLLLLISNVVSAIPGIHLCRNHLPCSQPA